MAAKGMTPNQKLEKLKKTKAKFEEAIKDASNPLSDDFIFVSLYDSYCKALEGAEEAYEYLGNFGRYYEITDRDGNRVPRSNPANSDFLRYLQQANSLGKTLSDLLKKEALTSSKDDDGDL